MRYLGIDYGTKRIGLSIGDDTLKIASPLSTLHACGKPTRDAAAVLQAAQQYEPDVFVLGLPINMDGSEGEQAKLTRDFGRAMARASGASVQYHDERLSSRAADELLQPAELTRGKHKARRDAVAAQVMLQSFLDAMNQSNEK